MSRTYRSNPSAKREYEIGRMVYGLYNTAIGEYYFSKPINKLLSKGGWPEAKRLLSKEDYAYQRTLMGDKLTHYLGNGGVARWYRNTIEKHHRYHTKRELQRYLNNEDYEPMVCENPSGDQYYYWY